MKDLLLGLYPGRLFLVLLHLYANSGKDKGPFLLGKVEKGHRSPMEFMEAIIRYVGVKIASVNQFFASLIFSSMPVS